jgi:predicted enzyme related to lactoylglutathione lyase
MIRGIHGLLYSTDAAATRAFFRDLVRLPGSDVGDGWWIFDFPEGDLGIHPAEDPADAGLHDVSIYCDDIEGTVRELRSRGVVFTAPVADHGYGLVTYFQAPGGVKVQLYEPRYVKRRSGRAAPKPAKPAKRILGKKTVRKKRVVAKKAPAKRPSRGTRRR